MFGLSLAQNFEWLSHVYCLLLNSGYISMGKKEIEVQSIIVISINRFDWIYK